VNATAQQDAMYSQYMFNMLSVNPAYAGSREVTSLTALKRWQWLNVEGAPRSATFSADLPVWKKKIGLGIQLLTDKIGVTRSNSVLTSYSYRIKLKKNSTLAFGLQAGFTNMRSDLASINTTSGSDPIFMQNVNTWLPNFGAGIYYRNENFYAGLSSPHLLNNKIPEGTQSVQKPHYFLMGGYMFEQSENLLVKPSVLIRYVNGAPVQGDINLNVWFQKKIGAGISYRTSDAFVVMAEFMINRKVSFGYAYDIIITPLNNYASGSHEIMLRYQMGLPRKENFKLSYF
jgi:type IX secretion system PorP/SprF family membrane protein